MATMMRMTGSDCAFMNNLINIHTDNVSSIQQLGWQGGGGLRGYVQFKVA